MLTGHRILELEGTTEMIWFHSCCNWGKWDPRRYRDFLNDTQLISHFHTMQCAVWFEEQSQWHLFKETQRTTSHCFFPVQKLSGARQKDYLTLLWLCSYIPPQSWPVILRWVPSLRGSTVLRISLHNTRVAYNFWLNSCVCSESELKAATVGVGRLIQGPTLGVSDKAREK